MKNYKHIDRAPSHAGRILKSGFIDQYNLKVETVAELLGVSRQHLYRIIKGTNPITSDMAIRLEVLTGTPASQWLTIQTKYDAYMLRQKNDFKTYEEHIHQWASTALLLGASERRNNETLSSLKQDISILAKKI